MCRQRNLRTTEEKQIISIDGILTVTSLYYVINVMFCVLLYSVFLEYNTVNILTTYIHISKIMLQVLKSF